jgi:hypothetical protein
MAILSKQVSLAFPLLAALTAATAFERPESEARRFKVWSTESIAEAVQTAHAQGNFKPRFTLEAELSDAKTVFSVNVREAEPAVTSKTATSIGSGESRYVDGKDVASILVSDEADVLALIAVEDGGKVKGIVEKGNDKAIKITQKGRGEKVRFMVD